jgi:membrane-associated phospholipid phosphatase
MCKDMARLRSLCQLGLLLTILIGAGYRAEAQSAAADPTPAPKPTPTPSLERRFLTNILQDQRAIFTSPLHLGAGDAKYLAPLGLATGALIATDQRTTNELIEHGDNQTRLNVSRDVSALGSVYGSSSIAAAFYLAGRATGNARARETGLLGAEALIDGEIVAGALKLLTQRPRPTFDQGRGSFRGDGDSFPSGHAVSAWSMATVIANEYKEKRWIVYTSYGLAAAVSVSRYTGRKHFLSDSLVGSAIGFGIGRYVYRRRHNPDLDGGGNNPTAESSTDVRGARLIPSVSPLYSRRAATYGLKLSWGF